MSVINPEDLYDATERRYSQARVKNGSLYMSGQVGRDSAGEIVGPDIESQTRQAFENMGVILEAVDEDFTSVQKITSYFTNIETDFEMYKTVWGDVFAEPYPAHTAIGVDALAVETLRLEVEAEVALDD